VKGLEFNQRSPVYIQVLYWFKKRIVTGEFKSGESIPSRRALATELKINPNTAQKVYRELEEQQLITTERNVPSKITMDQAIIDRVRTELLDDAVKQFVDAIHMIEVPLNDIIVHFKREYTIRKRGEIDA